MPKVDRKKKGRRSDVLQHPALASGTSASLEEDQSERLELLEQLESEDSGEREQACNSIAAVISEDPTAIRFFETPDAVALLFDRLVDKEVGVRIAACGALRNMCDAASVVLSEQLLARDILTILFANLEKANAELLAVAAKESEPPRPEQSGDEAADTGVPEEKAFLLQQRRDNAHALIIESIGLISKLCANCGAAADRVVQAGVAATLTGVLVPSSPLFADAELLLQVLEFFLLLTDENEPAIAALLQAPSFVPSLRELVRNEAAELLSRVTAAGILCNIGESAAFGGGWTQVGAVEVLQTEILPLLLRALDTDLSAALTALLPSMRQVTAEAAPIGADADAVQLWEALKETTAASSPEVERLRQHLHAQRLALELLANLCLVHGLGSEQEEPDDDAMEGPEEEEEEEAEEAAGNKEPEGAPALPTDLLLQIVRNFVPKVVPKLRHVEDVTGVRGLSVVGAAFSDLQSTAFECLNNFLLAIDLNQLGQAEVLFLWQSLCALCGELAVSQRHAQLASALSLLWSLLRSLPQLADGFTGAQAEELLQMAALNPHQEVRANCLGILAASALRPSLAPLAPRLSLLCADRIQHVLAETLNCIFDVFADNYAEALHASGLLPLLQQFLPVFTEKVRTAKRQLNRNLWERLDEARINLRRFLQYKAGS